MNDPSAHSPRADALEALLRERYSCRGYRPEPVPPATIERIVEIAQRTASWCNSQPWRIHVAGGATTDALREALGQHLASRPAAQPDFDWPEAYLGIYLDRRRACGFQLYEAVGVQRGDRAGAERQGLENFRFFGAPHVAIVTTDAKLGVYGAIDCGAWVSNFMLAARAFGVASIAQAALASYHAFWRERLGLGADRLVVCGISFGWPDETHPANSFRTARAPNDEVLRWIE